MIYRLLADSIVLIHLAFVIFAVFGGLLSIWWRKIIWLHLPSVLWSGLVETAGWICPLTPLENRFRLQSGVSGYSGGFIEHYIIPILYPADLNRDIQIIMGVLVILVNVLIYGFVFKRYGLKPRKNIDR
jgi:hypothetical protein